MDNLAAILMLIVIAVLLPPVLMWTVSRSHAVLDQWAHANHNRIVSANYCWIDRGPYRFKSTTAQSVYRIVVQDEYGETRQGWARCGSFWSGLRNSDIDVTWADCVDSPSRD